MDKKAYISLMLSVERLDKAMATPERIKEDTRLVGGFVSTLDLLETAEEIIDRAIKMLRKYRDETR